MFVTPEMNESRSEPSTTQTLLELCRKQFTETFWSTVLLLFT